MAIVAKNVSWRVNGETVDIYGKQGSTWTIPLDLQNPDGTTFDVTGWSGRGIIRKDPTTGTVSGTFTVVTGSNSYGGNLLISMTAAQTAALVAGKTQGDSLSAYQYDIELYRGNPEEVVRIIQGKLYVDPECTKT